MARDKNRKMISKVVMVGLVVLGFVAFRYFDIGQYLSLDYIKTSQEKFHTLYLSHRFIVIAAYMGIYIAVTALSLPGAAVLTLAQSFDLFRKTPDRPTLIIVKSHIGYGAPNKQDTAAAHGEPLGDEEIKLAKRYYGWPEDTKFHVPPEVRSHFAEGIGKRGGQLRADWFARWNKGVLDSYLIEITRDIMAYRNDDGETVLDKILDTAGQKGTGKWTVTSALDMGQPLTLIGEAVFARCLSALKDERVAASHLLNGPQITFNGDRAAMIEDLEQALYASKIVSYAQGYQLMRAVAAEQGWHLNYGGIALMWRGGCIIRSAFLGKNQGGV